VAALRKQVCLIEQYDGISGVKLPGQRVTGCSLVCEPVGLADPTACNEVQHSLRVQVACSAIASECPFPLPPSFEIDPLAVMAVRDDARLEEGCDEGIEAVNHHAWHLSAAVHGWIVAVVWVHLVTGRMVTPMEADTGYSLP
ncbi:MAG: hypothetical protein EBS89_08345, partial [Proteobacteria bacterium]|nr:hypothetical protein [Pseudomonadota bacterium]